MRGPELDGFSWEDERVGYLLYGGRLLLDWREEPVSSSIYVHIRLCEVEWCWSRIGWPACVISNL